MSDIFDAIKALEDALIEINGGAPLIFDTKGLNKDRSGQFLANPGFLPDPIEVPETVTTKEYDKKAKLWVEKQKPPATQEQLDEYSQHVLQAVFNIASASKDGYYSAITSMLTIKNCFNSLDITWVPKIVDKRTYQVGKALQAFLEEALRKEVLEQVPSSINMVVKTVEVREPAHDLLANLQAILNQRIETYEIHANLKRSKECLEIKEERRDLWYTGVDPLKKKLKELETLGSQIKSLLKEEPPTETMELQKHLEKLQVHLKELEQKHTEIKQAMQDFAQFNEAWKSKNDEMDLPKEIISSPFIRVLAAKMPDEYKSKLITKEWARLFNEEFESFEIYSERIRDGLEDDYKRGNKILTEDTKTTESTIQEKTELLHLHIANVTLLKEYIDADKTFSLPTINKPSCLNGESPQINLNIALSKEEDIRKRLETDKASYSDAIKKLEEYQQKLVEQKESVASLDLTAHLPAWTEEFPYQDTFKKARKEKQEQLIVEMESHINEVKGLIQEATLEEKRLDRELIKLDREKALKAAIHRIQQTFAVKQSSDEILSETRYEHELFMQQYHRLDF